ncbi:hypothetical protein Fot_06736 [Forsythia ovata]|uniref:Uncharacterized protein n=1 Tax=Forsythia ovata TaxID=205694 RepID=A0ABD1WTU0_9LAMI
MRRGWVVDDILSPPPISSVAFVPRIAILQAPETMVSSSSFIPLAPKVTSGVPSIMFPAGPVSTLENFRRSDKRKVATDSKEETSMPGKGMEVAGDSRMTGRGQEDPSSEVEDCISQDRGASQTHFPPPTVKYEYINIGSYHPTVLRKLPASAAIAAASVHKYWTSAFGKAANNAELMELLKLAEIWGGEDVDMLRLENKDLREQLTFSKDARAQAIYDITKAKTIQRACVQAQKKAESQLRSCQNMIHAKDKELTEVLTDLSNAHGLLAKLGVPGYADSKGSTGT